MSEVMNGGSTTSMVMRFAIMWDYRCGLNATMSVMVSVMMYDSMSVSMFMSVSPVSSFVPLVSMEVNAELLVVGVSFRYMK